MRSFAIAMLAASTASASAWSSSSSPPSKCPLLDSITATELAQYVTCADDSAIRLCLTTTYSHASKLDVLMPCLRVNGCEGTRSLLSLCEPRAVELRRRQDLLDNAATATSATADATTAKTTGKASVKASNTDAASTSAASETKASAAATTTANTQSVASQTTATITSTPSTDTTLKTSATSPTQYTTFAPDPNALVCFATSMVSTSFCGILTQNGAATTLPCVPTTTPSAYCAPGLICQTEGTGGTTCMVKDNSLTTSGFIVTIVFGSALAGCVALFTFFVCRNRRARKHRERMLHAEMARDMHMSSQKDLEAITSYSGVGGRGRHAPGAYVVGSEASLPLMQQQGPAGGVDPSYVGVRQPRMLQKEKKSSRDMNPMEAIDDIGYQRRV